MGTFGALGNWAFFWIVSALFSNGTVMAVRDGGLINEHLNYG
jgi:hypothetical protein